MFYVYVLQSLIDGRLYKGYTNNLDKRIRQHQLGYVKSTKFYRPWKMVYYEVCLNYNDAIAREKFFKSGEGREYLKNKLENYTESYPSGLRGRFAKPLGRLLGGARVQIPHSPPPPPKLL